MPVLRRSGAYSEQVQSHLKNRSQIDQGVFHRSTSRPVASCSSTAPLGLCSPTGLDAGVEVWSRTDVATRKRLLVPSDLSTELDASERSKPNGRLAVPSFGIQSWLRPHRPCWGRVVRRRHVDRRRDWFTSSTSFANPAVTIARTLSDSFAGIKPGWAPMFIAMAVVGAGLAYGLICFLYPNDAAAGITAAGGSPR